MSPDQLHGSIVSWDAPRAGASIVAVREALRYAGLPEDAAKDLGWKAAFSRGIKSLKKGRLIEVVSSKEGQTSFQFTIESNDGSRIDHTFETIVTLENETGYISCPGSPDLEDQIEGLVNDAYAWRTSADISKIVHELFKDNADLYPLNSKGVAYFVPIEYQSFVDMVKVFFERFGGTFTPFPVPKGTKDGNASVQEAVSGGLKNLLEEMNAVIDEYDDTTRGATIEKACERMNLIQYKISAYSQYLGDKQAELQTLFNEANARFREKALGIGKSDVFTEEPVAA
jgi:hypothetical protein